MIYSLYSVWCLNIWYAGIVTHLRVVIKYPYLSPTTQATGLDDPPVSDSIESSLREVLMQLVKQSFYKIINVLPKRLRSSFLGIK